MTTYVTTAIPYVNSRPHVGFALEAVLADAIARGFRTLEEPVRFLSGTDDNSLSNVAAAGREGIHVRELVERNGQVFRDLAGALHLSYDDFIATSSDPRHEPAVRRVWRSVEQAGDLYQRHYRGLYCVSCELFYADSELVDGLCPEHRTTPSLVDEENYFFKLSQHQEALSQGLRRVRFIPEDYRKQAEVWLEEGLEDFSVSRSAERSKGWGLEVPGDPGQVIYVWFDALVNYISALGYPEPDGLYRRFWSEASRRVHVIGKNIIRQHAIYWPAILNSARLPWPTDLVVHGFLTADGRKLSKSQGVVIDPFELTEEYGSEALRYALLSRPPEGDHDFSRGYLEQRYEADLVSTVGNLVSRISALVIRDFDGAPPAPGDGGGSGARLAEAAREAIEAFKDSVRGLVPHEGVSCAIDLARRLDRYLVETSPWAAEGRSHEQALGHAVEALRILAILIGPALPSASASIIGRLGGDAGPLCWLPGGFAPALRGGPHLFPRRR